MRKFILVLTSLLFFIVNNALAVKSNTVGSGTFKTSAGQLTQAPLNFNITSLTWSAENTSPLPAASGGSGSGAITYAPSTAACSVLNNVVTALSSGTCTVTATKAGDGNYSSQSISSSIVIAAQSQPSLTISVSPSSVQTQATATVSVSGGGGTGNISVTSSNANCSVNNLTVTGITAGTTCNLSATKAASGLFASAASNSVTLTIVSPVIPDSGALTNSYPQWAYFNTTALSDSSANATIANTKCQTLGSGWRLPTHSEAGPGTHVTWLDQNIGHNNNFFNNSNGTTQLNNSAYTGTYNYPYDSGFTINRIACYHQ
jgi:hypothetical protein